MEKLADRLVRLAKDSAVMAQPISLGDRHVVPICDIGIGFGGGGGEGKDPNTKSEGGGLGSGGGVAVIPVAVLVVDGKNVRLESLCD